MIDARRAQGTFGDGFVADAVVALQEAWMRHADVILVPDAKMMGLLGVRCRLGGGRDPAPPSDRDGSAAAGG